jgi:hypothetical protein
MMIFGRKVIDYLLKGILAGSLMLSPACQKGRDYEKFLEDAPTEYSPELAKKTPTEERLSKLRTRIRREIKIGEVKFCAEEPKGNECTAIGSMQRGNSLYSVATFETRGFSGEKLEGKVEWNGNLLAKQETTLGDDGKFYLNFSIPADKLPPKGKQNLEIIVDSAERGTKGSRAASIELRPENRLEISGIGVYLQEPGNDTPLMTELPEGQNEFYVLVWGEYLDEKNQAPFLSGEINVSEPSTGYMKKVPMKIKMEEGNSKFRASRRVVLPTERPFGKYSTTFSLFSPDKSKTIISGVRSFYAVGIDINDLRLCLATDLIGEEGNQYCRRKKPKDMPEGEGAISFSINGSDGTDNNQWNITIRPAYGCGLYQNFDPVSVTKTNNDPIKKYYALYPLDPINRFEHCGFLVKITDGRTTKEFYPYFSIDGEHEMDGRHWVD